MDQPDIRYPLCHRFRHGSSSVSDDGPGFPERDWQEIKAQLMEKEGKLPDMVIACVGGGSNAMGAFYEFIGDEE